MTVFWSVVPCSLVKSTDVSGICFFHYQGDGDDALMMEAADISETSVDVYHTTRRSISEDSNLQYLILLFFL
jgi:hypothetical protein